MKTRQRKRLFVSAALAVSLTMTVPMPASVNAAASDVTFTINTQSERAAISPNIYGTNQDLSGTENWSSRRLGGNRLTGYNWENNASSAGRDWLHYSDDFLCGNGGVPDTDCDKPGAVVTAFHDKSLENGAYSIVTLQMAGYVSRDKNGPVDESETAPSPRWDKVEFAKNAPFSLQPHLNDGQVYMDEEVNFLVNRYGNASTSTGIKAYSLDNEPALWSETHPRIHPEQLQAAELVAKSIDLSKAVKNVDPHAEIFGPALYGFGAYLSLQDAPGWPSLQGNYSWFIDYYLDQMKNAHTQNGKRLLDVLDVHWYPEAQGGGQRIVFGGAGNIDTQKARVQAPRSLWDPAYQEDSWIGTWFSSYLPLIPKLQSSIQTYYPGTKLAITESSYGGDNHISGGIATADALGIFGKYGVYAANYWQTEDNTDYTSAAYKLYRNYDGNKSGFGSIKVDAATSDTENSSVYASVTDEENSELHLIVLNKNFDDPINATFQLSGDKTYTSGRVWGFDQTGSDITEQAAITNINNNQFTYTLPPLSAYHIVLKADSTEPVNSDLVVQYKDGDRNNATDNQIKPHFNIQNKGTSPVDLSSLTLRYYFTKDSSAAMNGWIDWAKLGGSNIQISFGNHNGADSDTYAELGFSSGAGSIAEGGQSGEIQLRMSKADWSNFNEANDYSFDGAKTAYIDWDRVTLYQDGQLVWGIEP
uniref:Endoglucanase A n=1 Tax=Paenibacillus lautus TaxID=1401 RepID=GUNA_PAELA|nr:RecName: Full=Endoglucanase A; AltName: Full=Cellulase A; AltName: Full=EG-A; AltName: Full=Endo-1,4-beta-glucanase; Flags: Precursor [Paenibacillus lautus]AAA22303.1 endo-beta-1,4-glucanase [Paenibacillus lautus]